MWFLKIIDDNDSVLNPSFVFETIKELFEYVDSMGIQNFSVKYIKQQGECN